MEERKEEEIVKKNGDAEGCEGKGKKKEGEEQ